MKNSVLVWLFVVTTSGAHAQFATLPDVSGVTGAVVNESSISNVYYVRAQGGNNNNDGKSSAKALRTIFAAMQKAVVDLKQGTPTKILISGGTYRESLGTVDFGSGAGKTTPLVIEGAAGEKVVISGSQVYTDWVSVGQGIYEHPWTNDWGNLWVYSSFVDATLLAYRSEMVFVDGKPLRQEILEDYEKTGKQYTNYTGYTAPQQALTPGTFGVAERDENGNKIFIRPAAGINPANAEIEVAVQRQFVKFTPKEGLVWRNLTVQHFANTIGPGFDFQYVITFARGSKNILIEQSTFQWNNQFTLQLKEIDGFTLRNCVFQYNGGSGQDASVLTNSLFENNTTNFNNWRNYLGGATKWFLGGFKHQRNEGQIMRGHTSVGNLAAGCWWDISNRNQSISEIISVLNYREGFFYEISEGPVVLEKSLIALNALEGSSNFRNTSGVQTTFRNNIIYSNVPYRSANDVEVDVVDPNNPTDEELELISSLVRQGNFRTTMYPRGQPGAPPELGLGVNEAEVASAKMSSLNNVIMGGEREGFTWYFSENTNAGQNFLINDYQGDGNYFYHASGSSDNHFRAGAFDTAPIRDYEGYVAWAGDSEINSQFTDPGFEDAAGLDFRFTSSSPLKSREGNYLATAISPEVLRQCQEFWDWVGYEQTVPAGGETGGGSDPSPNQGRIVIRAKGDCGLETMELRVDGQVVKTWQNVATSFTEYTYDAFSGGEVSVHFTNDSYRDGSSCEDRNLEVDWITVCGTLYQTETQATETATCCLSNRSKLYTNGNFNFNVLSCSSDAARSVAKPRERIIDKDAALFTAYPNPASQKLNVAGTQDYQVTLYDLSGRSVMQHDHLKGRVGLDISHLRPGVYLMKVRDADQHQTSRRLIIE